MEGGGPKEKAVDRAQVRFAQNTRKRQPGPLAPASPFCLGAFRSAVEEPGEGDSSEEPGEGDSLEEPGEGKSLAHSFCPLLSHT